MDRDEELLLDLSSADSLTDAETRSWAAEQRVFISSIMADLSEERAAVACAIKELGAVPVLFERFGGRDDDPEAAYLSEVARADAYLGILGERYGKLLPSGYSATHAEYREALRRGLRISVWVSDANLAGPQRDFVDEVRVFRTTGSYTTSDDLALSVKNRLRLLAAEALAPWVKVGNAILRAQRVRYDGSEVRIEARVRDADVVAYLEAFRPGGFLSGRRETRVTWSGATEAVDMRSVETETVAGRGRAVTLVGRRIEASGRSSFVDVALSGRSPEDLTELALRVAVFGDENPLGMMSFMVTMENPFGIIEGLGIPEDAVEPIAHLLLTELLVGTGRADRVTALQVGPKHMGNRRLALSWLPRRRYTNTAPGERHIEGEVTLA